MSDLRDLPLVKIDAGKARPVLPMRAELAFVPTAKLAIDTSYQRDIGGGGRAHIERIACEFDWNKFAPLIVAPVPDGRFAIIDGQHRAIAARARGFTPLPAYVVTLTPPQQAAVFAAINGDVTPITTQHVFKAALAAGTGWAADLKRIASACGVTVLTYPKSKRAMNPGETMAAGTLRIILARHGEGVLSAILLAVTATRHNHPGILAGAMIEALLAVRLALPVTLSPRDFAARIATVDVVEMLRESHGGAAEAGISRKAWLAEIILDTLKEAAT